MKNGFFQRIISGILVWMLLLPNIPLTFASAEELAATEPTLAAAALKITSQPKSVTKEVGANARFYVGAEGGKPTYQWQFSSDSGATWTNSGVTTPAYVISATETHHQWMVRCVVSNADQSVTSKAASLWIDSLLNIAITEQPQDINCSIGDAVQLSVTAEGTALHYAWQYSANGAEWVDLNQAESTYSLEATADAMRRMYRCRIWDDFGNSTISDAVRLIDHSRLILSQPQNWIGSAGGKAFFELEVSDRAELCQWQVSANNGSTWKDSSITDPYYPITATEEKNGWLYRCVVSDAAGEQEISNPVSLMIANDFYIAAQPTTLYGNFDQTVTFAMQAGGAAVTFEWQRSADGEQWETVTENSPRLPQTIQLYNVGKYYRCVVTDESGATLTSDVVQLRWNSTGFVILEGKTYYVKEDGTLATGFETIGGKLYYFNEKGRMFTGYHTIGGKGYYFNRDGSAAKGFCYIHDVGGTLYFGADGAAATGWTEIGGKSYYFYENGDMASGITQIGEGEYYFDPQTGAQTYGLVKIGLNDYMYFEEGKTNPYTGLKTIGGKLYFFATSGRLLGITQDSMQTVGGKTYYFDPETKQAVSGFINHNDRVYYMGKDYAMVKNSFVTVDKKTYLLNSKGNLSYGLITYNKKQYYFDPDTGVAASGWVNLDGSKMYFDPTTHAAKTGMQTIDGIKYYFSAYGYLQTGVRKIDGVRYYCADQGQQKTGFVESNKNTYYVYANQKVATGLVTINKKQYYFGTDGIMRTGFYTISGDRYYFDPDTGASVTGLMQMSNSYTYRLNGSAGVKAGLATIGGELYCLDASGIIRYGRISVGGKIYYFDPANGKALTGWQAIQSSGTVRKAYFDPKTHCAVKGLKTIGGKLYYFDTAGWAKSGKQTINGKTYYFSPTTYEAYTGWYKNTDGDYSYFKGASGELKGPGLFKIDGAYYYLNAYGRRKTGRQTVKGVRMYFDPTTAQPVTGFVYTGGKLYYFNGQKGAKTGLQTINGKQYYFDKTGAVKTGMQTIGKKKYYFDEKTGVRIDGLLYEKKTGKYYLFDRNRSSGVKTSRATISGVLYVSNSVGALRTGYCHKSTSKLKYDIYLDTKTGEQQLGLIKFKKSGKTVTYYFKKGGCITKTTAVQKALKKALKGKGWKTVEGLKYYVKNGAFLKGKKTIGGKTYYFSTQTGAMLTGLRRIGSKRYYFDPKTGAMKKGLITIDGKRYYFDSKTGAQATGLKKIKNKYYYFTQNGALTGTVQVGSSKYKFNSAGAGSKVAAAKKTAAPVQHTYSCKWRTISGGKYYYNMNGKRVTGLQVIGGKLYYFDSNGKMQTGWKTINGSRYYFTASGAKSGKATIGGKEFYFSPISLGALTGIRKIGSALSYYDEKGIKRSGWVTTATGDKLYITSSGAQTGLKKIGTKTYYFGENGVMRTGLQQVTDSKGTKMACLFDEKGAMVTGLVKNSKGIYYYSPSTGARVTGLATVSGKEYYFDPTTGKAKTGLCNIDGVYYYFDATTAQRKYGLQTIKGKMRHFIKEGVGFSTGLKVVNNKTYYFNESKGIALSGYQIIDDERYYFDPKTFASVSGIYRVSDGVAYYFKAGGGIKTEWVDVGSKSYFFYPATGKMAMGLSSVGDYLYYFDFEKGALKNTTVTVGGIPYQFDKNGHGKAVGDSDLVRLINEGIASFDKYYGNENASDIPDSFTCSQLVTHVYETIGIDLIRRAARQHHMLANDVYESTIITDMNKAKAGDLIFFITTNCDNPLKCDYKNEIHHVGVYLGEGKILESFEIEGDDINNGPMIRDVADGLWSSVILDFVRIEGVNN